MVRVAALLATTVFLMLALSASAYAADRYEKTPGGTNAAIADSVFYVAVNEGPNGTGDRLYYYFSLDELRREYGVESRDFDYTNHTVGTITSAHGFSVTKLIDSLVGIYGDPLPIDDTWRIQYLEDDAYHAGAAYTDTITAARDITKPMLTFEIKETFSVPTKYNVNDTTYKWAENLYPEYLRVYRQADSANSSVMKMMMGIAVSPDGLAYNTNTAGKYALTGTDELGNQVVVDSKGRPGRIVHGALAGMKYGVHAPTVAAYTADQSGQLITVEPAETSTQSVAFTYTADRYLVVKNWITGTSATLSQHDIAGNAAAVQIPASLEEVQGLVDSGAAATIDADSIDPTSAEFTIAMPTRLLFVDTRVTPHAYGYTDLNLFRYTGAYAYLLAGVDAGALRNVVVTSTRGAQSLYKGADAAECFVAYKDTRSKGCPNNTAESKRFAWVYSVPKVIDEYDGGVLEETAARIDVNAPIVRSLRIRTASGARRATVRRGRSVRLIARTTPAKTVEKLTWKSSRSRVASVNARGKVLGRRPGTATITVTTAFGKKATFKVRIVK